MRGDYCSRGPIGGSFSLGFLRSQERPFLRWTDSVDPPVPHYFPPTYSAPEYGLDNQGDATIRLLREMPAHKRRSALLNQRESGIELPEAKRNRRFLYRYLAMDPTALDQELEKRKLTDLLVRGELYLSPVRQFNDPNEFRARVTLTPDPHIRREWIRKITRSAPLADLGPLGREATVDKIERKLIDLGEQADAFLQDIWTRQADDFGIACFCQNPRSPLMWAHYARSHRGVAIQFDYSLCPGVLSLAHRVRYRGDLPELVWPSDADRSLEPLLSKSSDWEYEVERRYVTRQIVGRTIRFDARAVTGVILGRRFREDSRIAPWLRSTLEERALRGLPSPKIYEAQESPSSYAMAIRRSRL